MKFRKGTSAASLEQIREIIQKTFAIIQMRSSIDSFSEGYDHKNIVEDSDINLYRLILDRI